MIYAYAGRRDPIFKIFNPRSYKDKAPGIRQGLWFENLAGLAPEE